MKCQTTRNLANNGKRKADRPAIAGNKSWSGLGWAALGLWLLFFSGWTLGFSQQRSIKPSTVSSALHPDSAAVKVHPDSISRTAQPTVADIQIEESERSLDDAIIRNETLLEKFPDDPFVSSAMFQLSELYVRKARHIYRREMIEYEKNLKLFENGSISVEPILPTIKLGQAIEMCYQILEKFPKADFKDRIYYRLAICHLDEANREQSNKYFGMLISDFPKSDYFVEGHFRIGEYYFNKRDFQNAILHYRELLNSWNNPYFNMALYKLGWSYYNIEDYVNSISTFVFLLGDIRLLEQADARILGKTNSQLRQEAIDYVAICFTEYGGAPEAKRFLVDLKKGNEDYNLNIFLKMGDIYQKRNYYEDAIATYRAILDIWPFYQYAPLIQQKIVETYESDLNTEKSMEARSQLVQQYGPGSKWLGQYPEGQVRNDAVSQAEKALYDYALYYQSQAQEKKRPRDYLIAIEKYRDYLNKFPKSSQSPQINFFLAECLYEIGEYADAGNEYGRILTAYGPNDFQEEAAYNRILSYYNLLGKNPATDTLVFYLEDFLGDQQVQPEAIKVGNKVEKDILQACNDFVVMLSQSQRLEEVLLKYAETLYNLRQYRLAAKTYERITNNFKGGKYYASAFSMLAQANFQTGNYEQAIKNSEMIIQTFPDSAQLIDKSKKLIASSGFKRAENFGKSNQPLEAANSFVNVANTTADPEIAKVAILRASAQFDSLGDAKKAVRVLEALVETKPGFKFAPELLFKAATLRERDQDWNWAVIDYMKIVDRFSNTKLAAKAFFNTALCYEKMEKWALAETTFRRFIDANSPEQDLNDVIAAHYHLAEIKYNQKNYADAELAFYNTVRKFIELKKANQTVDDFLPAKAQYLLGEISNERFRQIAIQEPLEQTLQEKKNLFNLTLKNYSNAIKFNIADWSTAAFYKIGQLYEEYAAALIQIPTSPDLSPEQVKAQQETILNQLRQEALKYYKTNVLNAEKAQIQNDWIEQSRKRMQALILELRLGKSSSDEPSASTNAAKVSEKADSN